MTSNSADTSTPGPRQRPRLSVDELARRKGVRPVQSLDEMTCEVFTSDGELDEFLAFVQADRQAGLA